MGCLRRRMPGVPQRRGPILRGLPRALGFPNPTPTCCSVLAPTPPHPHTNSPSPLPFSSCSAKGYKAAVNYVVQPYAGWSWPAGTVSLDGTQACSKDKCPGFL